MKDWKGVNLGRRGGGEELWVLELGETIIRMCYLRKELYLISKNGKRSIEGLLNCQ